MVDKGPADHPLAFPALQPMSNQVQQVDSTVLTTGSSTVCYLQDDEAQGCEPTLHKTSNRNDRGHLSMMDIRTGRTVNSIWWYMENIRLLLLGSVRWSYLGSAKKGKTRESQCSVSLYWVHTHLRDIYTMRETLLVCVGAYRHLNSVLLSFPCSSS